MTNQSKIIFGLVAFIAILFAIMGYNDLRAENRELNTKITEQQRMIKKYEDAEKVISSNQNKNDSLREEMRNEVVIKKQKLEQGRELKAQQVEKIVLKYKDNGDSQAALNEVSAVNLRNVWARYCEQKPDAPGCLH